MIDFIHGRWTAGLRVLLGSGLALRTPGVFVIPRGEHFGQSATAVGGGKFFRVKVRLGAEILVPLVEIELVAEAVGLAVSEMGFADGR